MINWKKNNKVAIRNFKEACDFHDVVKMLLVRMLRRKHPNSSKVPIYTEFNPDQPNETFPDIWMKDEKRDLYVWELQEVITEQWEQRMNEQYKGIMKDLFIVRLKDLNRDSISLLKKQLEVYVI